MIEVKPSGRCDARVTIPGSKSYTHRALVVSALADGESILLNGLACEDTEWTIKGLERLGVPVLWKGDRLHVFGKGGKLNPGETEISVGNSGTSMRFLTALASLKNGRTLLDGNERMRQRPILALLEGLEALKVRAYCRNGDGCPPVVVESRGLQGGIANIRGDQSSQFLSALLMVAPYAERKVHLRKSVV